MPTIDNETTLLDPEHVTYDHQAAVTHILDDADEETRNRILNLDDTTEYLKIASGAAVPDVETDKKLETEQPERTPEEEPVFANPFKDQGIPDHLLKNKEGQPYENGLIEGKYKTPDDFWKGYDEKRRLAAGKHVTEYVPVQNDGAEHTLVDYDAEAQAAPLVTLTDDQTQILEDGALMEAVKDVAAKGLFARYGVAVPETVEDARNLSVMSEALDLRVQELAQDHKANVLKELSMGLHYKERADDISDQAAVQAFEGIRNDVAALIPSVFGDPTHPDYQDSVNYLESVYADFVAGIDAKFKSGNPALIREALPYYENRFGTPVLNEEVLKATFLLDNRKMFVDGAANAASRSVTSRYRERTAARVSYPALASAAGNLEAVSGAHPGITEMTEAELMDPHVIDKWMSPPYNMSEGEALRELDRQADMIHAREKQMSPGRLY